MIKAHKAGEWSVEGDRVVVGSVVLEPGEYALELVASDDKASAPLTNHDGVIALDVEVTEELEVEAGTSRVQHIDDQKPFVGPW